MTAPTVHDASPETALQWKDAAVEILHQENIPVVDANWVNDGACLTVDFIPRHPIETSFRPLLSYVQAPRLALVWCEIKDSQDEWQIRIIGENALQVSCGNPEEPDAELHGPPSEEVSVGDSGAAPGGGARKLRYLPDHEAFEARAEELDQFKADAVTFVTRRAIESRLEPEAPGIRALFSDYVNTLPSGALDSPGLLFSYLVYYGSHIIDQELIDAHRVEFLRDPTPLATAILQAHPQLSGQTKPTIRNIVVSYMQKSHHARCISKDAVEPITSEIVRLRTTAKNTIP